MNERAGISFCVNSSRGRFHPEKEMRKNMRDVPRNVASFGVDLF